MLRGLAVALVIWCLPREASAGFKLPRISLPRNIPSPGKEDVGHALKALGQQAAPAAKALEGGSHQEKPLAAVGQALREIKLPAGATLQDALRETGAEGAADSLALPKELGRAKVRDVVKSINEDGPKVVAALKTARAQRLIQALRSTDPAAIEDAVTALELWRWWKDNWQWPLLASLFVDICLVGAWWAFCRGRRKRRQHAQAGLPDAEEPLCAEMSEV